jgi:hypothetical protein
MILFPNKIHWQSVCVCRYILIILPGMHYEGVSKSFRTKLITKYMLTTINTCWEATQMVVVAKLTRLTHKIAIQLCLVAESCTICSSCSRWPVWKLLGTPLYLHSMQKDTLPEGYVWPLVPFPVALSMKSFVFRITSLIQCWWTMKA